ncbi:tRNA (adenosine(37)-N6)-threonylcarbamoyltransferase complex dimerization subunit type 1 TsaB [Panacibacter sp. DH6]|uniref:tRNA (Adenosine(37)-N6)-threonylcarbamoyltransferase complex dimerization subunit type 1 TsaB n=1 Tax=Panacibacter microcysteis TaxID=2793269 RepID=A0A931GYJ0_9BACT|nr:tRNA (adenosine(37)-N6)-threonylcarbamoyltransferase complex dimerization subunit type 1 TsaB [Panacibacter microcysteis]MBG9376257.1 tRNA (adenosine(37)-N6)-threonylcarbamoyltransferase complex dimerization subunit type 1 TsaB [Panacibacter microcysteis]
MALLLSIDTATGYAGVCISENAYILALEESRDQKNHGAFLQPAIASLRNYTGVDLNMLDAVAVTAGPGSYTGLRVGLATAKGLCYALQKPLIMINTLEVMAQAVIETGEIIDTQNVVYCPMIDARRMEVFTALFDSSLNYIRQACAMILSEIPPDFFPPHTHIVFSGSGSNKLKQLEVKMHTSFSPVEHTIRQTAVLGHKAFDKQLFNNLAYSEPVYVKEFFTHQSVPKT